MPALRAGVRVNHDPDDPLVERLRPGVKGRGGYLVFSSRPAGDGGGLCADVTFSKEAPGVVYGRVKGLVAVGDRPAAPGDQNEIARLPA